MQTNNFQKFEAKFLENLQIELENYSEELKVRQGEVENEREQ